MTLNQASARRSIRVGRIVMMIALAMLAALFVLALEFTPTERTMGLVQKLFYLHPPAAYAMQLAFIMVGVASALYLWLRDARLDAFAEASAEVGLVLGVIVLITGPIWGKPAWGTWWVWEPRLTFTVLEMLVMVGYFALRSAIIDPDERAKFAAVLGVTTLVLVPFNHLTVYLFRSQHPTPVVVKTEKPALPWEMLRTFLSGFITFTVIYIGAVMQRYGIGVQRMLTETQDDT
jgi:heme exporter protein C